MDAIHRQKGSIYTVKKVHDRKKRYPPNQIIDQAQIQKKEERLSDSIKHKSTVHEENKPQCTLCESSFLDQKQLNEHISEKHIISITES